MKIWLWPPASSDPVRAAELTHDAISGEGRWSFTSAYLQRSDAYSPDPLHLPLTERTHTTRVQGGWFGVLVDSAPGFFGRKMLREERGRELTEEELLLEIPAHGSGAVLVGEPTPGRLAPPPSLTDVLARAAAILSGELGDVDSARLLSALTFRPTTGGAKPKMDVLDEWGHMCIAKFPDVGDPPSFPRIEAGAMELAAQCGIEVAEPRVVRFEGSNGEREALLQRRFDRLGTGAHVEHQAFASGHTVLDLTTGNEDHAHYGALSHELQRWCGRGADKSHAMAQRRELWRRIVFNGLIGNVDDHARNIGVLRRGGVWHLAPAFDLVPFGRTLDQHCALRMSFDRVGRVQRVSYEALIECAPHYQWAREDADIELRRMAEIIVHHFDGVMAHWKVPDRETKIRRTAIGVAEEIVSKRRVGNA
jgi:serine/threonine-protein kinase HipA